MLIEHVCWPKGNPKWLIGQVNFFENLHIIESIFKRKIIQNLNLYEFNVSYYYRLSNLTVPLG